MRAVGSGGGSGGLFPGARSITVRGAGATYCSADGAGRHLAADPHPSPVPDRRRGLITWDAITWDLSVDSTVCRAERTTWRCLIEPRDHRRGRLRGGFSKAAPGRRARSGAHVDRDQATVTRGLHRPRPAPPLRCPAWMRPSGRRARRSRHAKGRSRSKRCHPAHGLLDAIPPTPVAASAVGRGRRRGAILPFGQRGSAGRAPRRNCVTAVPTSPSSRVGSIMPLLSMEVIPRTVA